MDVWRTRHSYSESTHRDTLHGVVHQHEHFEEEHEQQRELRSRTNRTRDSEGIVRDQDCKLSQRWSGVHDFLVA